MAPNPGQAPANEQSGPDALVEQRGHTLIVTLNRPHARNALSTEMMEIMVAAWDRVDNDDDIRCCILTGAGGYFCAGMDLKTATKKPPGDSFKDGSYDPSRIDALLKGRRLTKPLIAAVEGPAIAGGTEILQGTDIRVAGESAKFGISEAKWSLYPMGGSAVRLVRQIPYTVACDLLLTGRHITAAEAKDMGLIGYIVPDGQALTKALELADVISATVPWPCRRSCGRSVRQRDSTRTTPSRSTPRSVSRCSCPTTPKKARRRSPRSASPTSRTASRAG